MCRKKAALHIFYCTKPLFSTLTPTPKIQQHHRIIKQIQQTPPPAAGLAPLLLYHNTGKAVEPFRQQPIRIRRARSCPATVRACQTAKNP
jgi:hypothetical protein